jgi:hypothetical protein
MHLTNRRRPSSSRNIMPSITTAPSVLIRAARGSDGPALRSLAALDSSVVPAGELLVAEADGELVAARALTSGATIADPFRPTADVVELLELRGAALHVPVRRTRNLAERLGLRGAPRSASRTA